MHFRLRRQCRSQLLCVLSLGICFFSLWTVITLAILAASSSELNRKERSFGDGQNDYIGRGIQVVVGHYNGKMPEQPKYNLTADDYNRNAYKPDDEAGQGGHAVKLNTEEETRAKQTYQINQFNLVASDKIAIDRWLPDVRKQACIDKKYPPATDLPTTSVIIVYHNEAFSSLMRTVVSIITRSPAEVLKEIILVDDFSNRTFLHKDLDDRLTEVKTRVKVIRAAKRIGLIRARLMGAAEASGDVLTFLDSHCEVTPGWLEPLLARIHESETAVVCPIIDVINEQTFAYQRGIEMFRGGFNWNLQFRWYAVPPSEMKRRAGDGSSAIKSPTMAGGLFSISKRYFERLGTYDSQMDIWGGENLELSFRIWQCGGTIEILPCSHVGHIFRKASPHDFPGKDSGKILNTNLVRAAEVWMDDWKYLFYKTAPQAAEIAKTTEVSTRLAIREQLQCKDFRWYLDNIYFDHFLPLPESFFGRIQHLDSNDCLHSTPGETGKRRHSLSLRTCTLGFDLWQLWVFDPTGGTIRSDEHQCLGAQEVNGVWIVQLHECAEGESERWDFDDGTMRHRVSQLCLQRQAPLKDTDPHMPSLTKCKSRWLSKKTWSLNNVEWRPTQTNKS